MNPPGRRVHRPPRRTQQQRADATRTALLSATIHCLVQDGYQHLTLTKVSEQAGLSVGAHLHHFKTRNTLVAAAIGYLADLRVAEAQVTSSEISPDALLDLMWELHSGDLYFAAIDLIAAARTDAELRGLLLDVETRIEAAITTAATHLSADYLGWDGLGGWVHLVVTTIRGIAQSDCLHPERDRDEVWRPLRQQLLDVCEVSSRRRLP